MKHRKIMPTNPRSIPSRGLFEPLLAVALLATLCTTSVRAQSPDTPHTGIVDQTGTINAATQGCINAVLLELEQKELAMFKVLVIQSTLGRDPYDYAIDTARQWKLSTRGKDNGLLLLVAIKDRKWRFVTGEGLEGAVPDLFTDRVARQEMVPFFKQGDYASGIQAGVVAIARKIAADAQTSLSSIAGATRAAPRSSYHQSVPPGGGHVGSRNSKSSGSACCVGLFPLLFCVLILSSILSRSRGINRSSWGGGGFWQALFLAQMLGGGRRHSGWGGGSSWGGGFGGGSGGGGFGGGFGGSFGGGGSGGSW